MAINDSMKPSIRSPKTKIDKEVFNSHFTFLPPNIAKISTKKASHRKTTIEAFANRRLKDTRQLFPGVSIAKQRPNLIPKNINDDEVKYIID